MAAICLPFQCGACRRREEPRNREVGSTEKDHPGAEPFDAIKRLHAAADDQAAAIAEYHAATAEAPIEEEVPDEVALPTVTSVSVLLRLLARGDEKWHEPKRLARWYEKLPIPCGRQRPCVAGRDKQIRAILEKLRQQDPAGTTGDLADKDPNHSIFDVGVELVEEEDDGGSRRNVLE